MIDIPCGDFNWMKEIDLGFLSYTGADIVQDIVNTNNEKFSDEKKKFIKLDITNQSLPQVDLILCRDLFIHLSFKDIFLAIKNIKNSGAIYLLANSYPSLEENKDISTGRHHHVNISIEPFIFPKPLTSIDEKAVNPKIIKKLCLWKIKDLKDIQYKD